MEESTFEPHVSGSTNDNNYTVNIVPKQPNLSQLGNNQSARIDTEVAKATKAPKLSKNKGTKGLKNKSSKEKNVIENETVIKESNWVINEGEVNTGNNNLDKAQSIDSGITDVDSGINSSKSTVTDEQVATVFEDDQLSPIHKFKRQFTRSNSATKSLGAGSSVTPKQPKFSRSDSASKSFGVGQMLSDRTPSITPSLQSASLGSLAGSTGTLSTRGSSRHNIEAKASGRVTPVHFSENPDGRNTPINTLPKATGTLTLIPSGRITPVLPFNENTTGRITPVLFSSNKPGRTTPVPISEKQSGRITPVDFIENHDEVLSVDPTSTLHTSAHNFANGRITNGYTTIAPSCHTGSLRGDKVYISRESSISEESVTAAVGDAQQRYLLNGNLSPIMEKSNGSVSPEKAPPSPSDSRDKIWDSKEEEDIEKQTVICCAPEVKVWKVIVKMLLCVLAGSVFGWCLEKGRVFEPASIRLQMVFRRWVMLKMFLAATASGQIIISVISLLPWTQARFNNALRSFTDTISEKKGIITSIIGPFVLGMGMTLSGACPGMVLAQVGAWTKNSIFTLLGLLVGAFIYGLLGKYIVKLSRPRKPFKKHTVHQTFGVPYAALALPMAIAMVIAIALMEWFINWEDDLDYYNRNNFDLDTLNTTDTNWNIFTMKSWPPSIAGGLIGLMQITIIFTVTDTLGGSSSYVTIVSQWVIGKKLSKWFPYMANARAGIGNWWQVFYVGGAILGGCFSSLASDSIGTTKGGSIVTAFFGGILMIIGSRFGAGCTSGHGLSGMGLLFWMSFLAVPAMFAGGIVTAFSMDATGALEDFSCFDKYQWMCD